MLILRLLARFGEADVFLRFFEVKAAFDEIATKAAKRQHGSQRMDGNRNQPTHARGYDL